MSDNFETQFTSSEENSVENSDRADVATTKFLTFMTDKLLFGIDATHVVEIIINLAVTRVPMVPEYVRGIINLRGQTIPLLDMRVKLGGVCEESECIIVLNVDDTAIGIMVDSVCQIVDIPEQGIRPVPTQNAQKYVSGMASLPDQSGAMLVLDCALLLDD